MDWDIFIRVIAFLFDLMIPVIAAMLSYVIKENKKAHKKSEHYRKINCIKNDIIKLLIKRQTAQEKDIPLIDREIEQYELKIKEMEHLI